MTLSIYDVFTPGKTTTLTYIERTHANVADDLRTYLRRGGSFISVVGPTKMGKTVLVEREAPDAVFLQGQSIRSVSDMWSRLGAYFAVPIAQTSGLVTTDRTKWGFFGKFNISVVGFGSNVSGETGSDISTQTTTESHADQVLPGLVAELRRAGQKITIVLDDFHFIDEQIRKAVIQALKPLAHKGASVVIVTLSHRSSEASRLVMDVGGRTEKIEVQPWSTQDLARIAAKGFEELNLSDPQRLSVEIAEQSYGSPQIMQQLSLELCERINRVETRGETVRTLREPEDWVRFWRLLRDEDSSDWLRKLDSGPKQRGQQRIRHKLKDGTELDGYGVILRALRALSPRLSFGVHELNAEISRQLESKQISAVGVVTKLGHMSAIAAKSLETEVPLEIDMSTGVEDPAAGSPQPVFEYVQEREQVHILEPYLAYTLKWHSDALLGVAS